MPTSQEEIDQLRIMSNCTYEIDELAPIEPIVAAQELADRVSAMLTKLIRSAEQALQSAEHPPLVTVDRDRRP